MKPNQINAMNNIKFISVAEYISNLPAKSRRKLKEMRELIREAAPRAEELISYNMPAFKWHGMLVWYGAHTDHVGFYPTGSGVAKFKKELEKFVCSKGTIQFPLDRALPAGLITKIVKFRVHENEEKAKAKAKK